jgi:hypothetical protein
MLHEKLQVSAIISMNLANVTGVSQVEYAALRRTLLFRI